MNDMHTRAHNTQLREACDTGVKSSGITPPEWLLAYAPREDEISRQVCASPLPLPRVRIIIIWYAGKARRRNSRQGLTPSAMLGLRVMNVMMGTGTV